MLYSVTATLFQWLLPAFRGFTSRDMQFWSANMVQGPFMQKCNSATCKGTRGACSYPAAAIPAWWALGDMACLFAFGELGPGCEALFLWGLLAPEECFSAFFLAVRACFG